MEDKWDPNNFRIKAYYLSKYWLQRLEFPQHAIPFANPDIFCTDESASKPQGRCPSPFFVWNKMYYCSFPGVSGLSLSDYTARGFPGWKSTKHKQKWEFRDQFLWDKLSVLRKVFTFSLGRPQKGFLKRLYLQTLSMFRRLSYVAKYYFNPFIWGSWLSNLVSSGYHIKQTPLRQIDFKVFGSFIPTAPK